MMKNKEYIQKKQNNSKKFRISHIDVVIKDELTNNVSPRETIEKLTNIIPNKLMSNITNINIGTFGELVDREIQALYKDSTIYVTNRQQSNEDLLDDLVHEVAHSVEEMYSEYIYSDKKIENEFISKRKDLWFLIKNRGFQIELDSFLNPKFDQNLDMFLYKKVGYPLLSAISSTIFYSPYAATSLREYFANGFEAFFLKEEINRLRKISPILFEKIKGLQ